jgi:hypothetical protein
MVTIANQPRAVRPPGERPGRVSRATLMAGVMLLAGAATAARVDAQASSVSGDQLVRIEWTVDPARGKWQPVCGYVYNDAPQATREVRLLVEGRDAADRVVDARRYSVLGYIPARGRSYFCSTAAAGAARYSVTVEGVQWGGER